MVDYLSFNDLSVSGVSVQLFKEIRGQYPGLVPVINTEDPLNGYKKLTAGPGF